jgi:hypothetical protein
MLVAGEEHPLDRPPRLLQPGPRVRTRNDHDITGRNPDDQLPWYARRQLRPELLRQQHARLQPVEREHQRRRPAVDLRPAQVAVEMIKGEAAQRAAVDRQPVKIRPADESRTERRTVRVGDSDTLRELVEHVTFVNQPIGGRHQER